jgi:hypothetical protein
MQRLEVSGAVRPLYGSLGVKGLTNKASCSKDILYNNYNRRYHVITEKLSVGS